MKLWQGLGYYSRARNLCAAARKIVENHQGAFPNTYEEVRGLPGIGDYTAGAILSIAFGKSIPAVDGNVMRVVARITGDSRDISAASTRRSVTRDLAQVIPTADPGAYNQALMELGATVCLPNGAPLCHRCPAADFCRARLEGKTNELPVKAPKKARTVRQLMVYLIFYDHRVALRRRPDKGLLAGLWEYPNLPAGEDGLALWGLKAADRQRAGTARHLFTHVEWHMEGVAVHLDGPRLPEGWVWADRGALERDYALPTAFRGFARQVADEVGRF